VFASWTTTATTMFRAAGLSRKRADELATTVVAALGGAFILARTAKNADHMRTTGRNLRALIRLFVDEGAARAKRTQDSDRRVRSGRTERR